MEPLLLLGHAKSGQQQIRLRSLDFLDNRCLVFGLKIAIPRTDDFNTGIKFLGLGLGLLCHAGSRTKEEHLLFLARSNAHEFLRQVKARYTLRHFIT